MRIRSCLECGFERAYDRSKIVVSNPYCCGAAMMGLTGLQPVSTDARKVRDIEGHENPLLDAGDLQQLLIWTAVEVALFIDCKHIMLAFSQGRTDPAARHVSV